MPTPFVHLLAADRLLHDSSVDPAVRRLLDQHRGAFWLGNIAPDARVSGQLLRVKTHFHDCRPNSASGPADQTLLGEFPELRRSKAEYGDPQVALIAGYLAHLAVDQTFCERLVKPYLVQYAGTPDHQAARQRWQYFLSWMDDQCYDDLPASMGHELHAVEPDGWLPFMPAVILRGWRDLVATQMKPDGTSDTFAILGERVNLSPEAVEAVVRSPQRMEAEVWSVIPYGEYVKTNAAMMAHMWDAVLRYMAS